LTSGKRAAVGGAASPYDPVLTGRIVWRELTADLLAALTADALASGATARAEAEPHRVPDEPPYAVDLVESAVVPLSEVVVGDDNARLRRAAGAPGPDEYAVAGRRLTFAAARAGQYIYADYFYANEGAGRTLVLNPFGAAAEFKLLAALDLDNGTENLYACELVLAAERCRPTGPPADMDDDGTFGFAFAIENRAAGDVTFYFP